MLGDRLKTDITHFVSLITSFMESYEVLWSVILRKFKKPAREIRKEKYSFPGNISHIRGGSKGRGTLGTRFLRLNRYVLHHIGNNL